MRKFLLLLGLCSSGAMGTNEYAVNAHESQVRFTAVQQGAEFQGRFERFEARIVFDPADLANSHIEGAIDLVSVNTMNRERDGYLLGEEWFNVELWPKATFVTERIEEIGEGSYAAVGKLSLRDITRDVRMNFTFRHGDDPAGGGARLQGTMTLNRLDFGIGQGEWRDTQWVGAEVVVEVDLSLSAGNQESSANGNDD
jgi:polyisoprenoid-binding protein YceI